MQAMRILRSYDPGETVSLDVLRKQKHITVSWKVPENQGEGRVFRMSPRMHEEPSVFRLRPTLPLKRAPFRSSGKIKEWGGASEACRLCRLYRRYRVGPI